MSSSTGSAARLLERAARRTPLLICLDDLQWTDSGTAAALRALPDRLAAAPVAWVLAFRPSPVSRQFKSALDHLEYGGAVKMVLEPLAEPAVKELTASVLRADPDAGLLKMVEQADGNPFFLVEMLSGRAGETMRWRLDQMSELARQAAAAATALGQRFPLSDLAAMLARPPSALLAPVEEMLQAGLFVERDNKLGFRHDLILEAVQASLPAAVSRTLDRQAAAVLMPPGPCPPGYPGLLPLPAIGQPAAQPGDRGPAGRSARGGARGEGGS